MDAALQAKAQEMWLKMPRKHVRVSDILAVIERESHGAPIFHTEDKLYHANVKAASQITGLSRAEIVRAATIEHGALKGMVAKFRCEPGYWKWSNTLQALSPGERFLLACSFGLGQKMARWLVVKTPKPEWISFVKNFMGSISLQVLYVAGDLDALLAGTNGDRALAFARYNGGPAMTKQSRPYREYGIPVAERAAQIEKELKGEC